MSPISTPLPILYSFRRCPYAIRARIAIYYSGTCVELREVVLQDKPPDLLAHSKKGTVPVLVSKQNIIDESIDIVRWALSKNDPDSWWVGLSKHDCMTAEQLINENDFSFKTNLDQYKYADRFPEYSVETYRREAEIFLKTLEQLLTRHRFLVNNKITIADIAIFPFVRQFCFVDQPYFESTSYTYLKKWLSYFLCSKLFTSVMAKYPQWVSGESGRCFPGK